MLSSKSVGGCLLIGSSRNLFSKAHTPSNAPFLHTSQIELGAAHMTTLGLSYLFIGLFPHTGTT